MEYRVENYHNPLYHRNQFKLSTVLTDIFNIFQEQFQSFNSVRKQKVVFTHIFVVIIFDLNVQTGWTLNCAKLWNFCVKRDLIKRQKYVIQIWSIWIIHKMNCCKKTVFFMRSPLRFMIFCSTWWWTEVLQCMRSYVLKTLIDLPKIYLSRTFLSLITKDTKHKNWMIKKMKKTSYLDFEHFGR